MTAAPASHSDEWEPSLLELIEELTATVEQPAPEVVLIAVRGALDMATVDLIDRAVERALDHEPPPQRLVLDLAAVDFMGSAGLNTLARARAMTDCQSVKFQLRGARHRAVALPLRTSGLDFLFEHID